MCENFYFFCQHITSIPTLRSLLEQPDNGIDAFLAPGHVSMVMALMPIILSQRFSSSAGRSWFRTP
ncbi:hypothetical protein ACNKHV_17120 [Shigella flexneri]